jgi:hypothetical protein
MRCFDRIVNWCFSTIINKVGISSIINKLFNSIEMSLTASVEYRRLPVSVNVIHIAIFFFN